MTAVTETGTGAAVPAPAPGAADRASTAGRRIRSGVALAVVVSTAVLGLIWTVTGVDPVTTMSSFVEGSVGGRNAVARTVVRAVPLALVGLGASVALRGGVVNVGGEGQMAIGAVGAVLAVQAFGSGAPGGVLWPAAAVAGAAAAAAWAVVPAVLQATRGVSEILSTLLLNFITVNLLLYLLELPVLADPDPYVITPQGAPIPGQAQLPILLGGTRLHAGVLVAAVATVAVWWWRRTPSAVRVELIGANPELAAQAGLRPVRARAGLLLLSAAFAGVAAAVQLLGVSHRVTTGLTGGIGYTALLVAVLGRRTALGTAVAALGFAALVGGGETLEFEGVPRSVVVLVQAVAVIAVAAGSRRRAVA